MSFYKNCVLCPRRCGVNREAGITGYCGETSALRIAFAGIHKGEEPPITGSGGSGTVFISGCNLGCAFCQNFQLSEGKRLSQSSSLNILTKPEQAQPKGGAITSGKTLGRIVEKEEFAEICLALERQGAGNINIVTGSHAAPALVLGIEAARKRGLSVPVLWNSSGYDETETLEIIKDVIDVYLPDLKTLDSALAAGFFNAPDYPDAAKNAVLKMLKFRNLEFTGNIMVSGVMVRHLILPGYLESTRNVLAWFSENCHGHALLSLMTQYTPVNVPDRAGIPNRYLSEDEYEEVLCMLDEYGIDNGYCQELVTGSEWLPDFNRPNPFSSDLSVPVWHF